MISASFVLRFPDLSTPRFQYFPTVSGFYQSFLHRMRELESIGPLGCLYPAAVDHWRAQLAGIRTTHQCGDSASREDSLLEGGVVMVAPKIRFLANQSVVS